MDNADNYENLRFTASSLVSQTQRNIITWKCARYYPASLSVEVGILDEDGKPEKRLNHMGTFYVTIADREYELDLSEGILLDGEYGGMVDVEWTISDGSGAILDVYENNIAPDPDCCGLLPLCDAIFEQAERWFDPDFFSYVCERSYFPSTDITAADKRHPLSKLMVRLMNERRVVDFHKCVLDRGFREKLLCEIG